MYDSRQWSFLADMDYSGSVTISDIWLWFKWLYFYPGDYVVYFLVNKAPSLGNFLEITYSNYAGALSGIVSFFAWFVVLIMIGNLWEEWTTPHRPSVIPDVVATTPLGGKESGGKTPDGSS